MTEPLTKTVELERRSWFLLKIILKFIPFRVHATYNGIIEERKKIKKGELSITKIKDNYYGYYNHNAPIGSKENRFYYNWINSLNVTINCLDGVIKDSKEENEKNPIEIKYSEMLAD